MKVKSIMVLAVAAAFALPAAAQMSPRTDTGGAPLTGGSNAADRTPNAPKADTGTPAVTPGAAGGSSPAAGGFAGIDRNGDGFISRDEARDATWNNRFTELDKDNDGRLSQSEFDAMGTAATGSSGSSTTGGMGGPVGPAGTQSGSSTSGIGDKPGQKQ